MKKLYFFLTAMMISLAANATDYYIVGDFNGWKGTDDTKFTATSTTGVYTLNYTGTLTTFKINDGAWDNGVNIGSPSDGGNVVEGTAYTYFNDGNSGNFSMESSIENPTITLDTNAGTILVEGTAVADAFTYALNGSFADGSSWAATSMTDSGDGITYTATITVEAETAQFGINRYNNGSWSAWYAASGETTISGDTELTLVSENTTNISISKGTYTFSFNTETLKLTVKGTASGIDAVESEASAAPVYYNLQGQEISNPSGLVIVKQGNKTKKLIVKP